MKPCIVHGGGSAARVSDISAHAVYEEEEHKPGARAGSGWEKKNMAANKGQLLQDPFLNALRREHVPVSIYLVNGIKLQGQIESFDQYVVLLRNTVTQMVYKHAISTVVPTRAVSFTQAPQGAEN